MYILTMNVIKYLKKANIKTEYDSKTDLFMFSYDEKKITYSKTEIEQYLFIRLVELIKD
jgi:hypothetical protein